MATSSPHLLQQAAAAQQEGRWADAEAAYREVLVGLEGRTADAALLANWGHVLRQLGKRAEALDAYRWATAQPGAPPGAWFNMGNALFDGGEWQEAETCFQRALELDAVLEPAALQLARCAVRLGQLQLARERFAAALRINPSDFTAWLETGHLCKRHGTLDQVLSSYRRAVSLAPQRWVGHASLANALEGAGLRDEAARHYWHAQRCPDSADGLHAHRLMGSGRLERGDAAGAVEALAHCLRFLPDDASVQTELADALARAGEVAGAQALFTQASRSTERTTLERLAEVMYRHNYWEQAESVFRTLLAAHPEDWATCYNLAKILVDTWRLEEGLEMLARSEACSAKPVPGAGSLRASAASMLGDSDLCLRLYRDLAKADGDRSGFYSSAAMMALYSDTLSAQQAAQIHREMFVPLAEGARTAFPNARDPARRLRIGYVTADMHHQHPVNLFMQPVLARHDASLFEVTVYHTGVMVDEQTRLAKSRVHRWHDVAAHSDAQQARLVAADGIDLLIDLMGHTTSNRRVLFGQRAAPVQATFLGYPSSTGVPNIDWIVADGQVAPPGTEPLFSERIARLPHCVFCHSPEEDYVYPAYGPAHARRPLTFGSFNNISKLTPSTIALWAKVLAAVPESRLLLKAPTFMDAAARGQFTALFAAKGVDAARIECRGPSSLSNMMAEYAEVDIALDTWPYNGGTTTCQALWMGVPVVTLAGEGFWRRMGASILNAIGRPEWVAQTPAQFVKIAKQLSGKRLKLLAEKEGLRARMQASPALDIDQYVRDLEAQYRMMWKDWCGREQ